MKETTNENPETRFMINMNGNKREIDDADDDNDGVADDGDGAVLFTLGQGKAGKAEPCIQKCEYLQSDRSVFSKVVSGSCQRQQNFV